MTKLDVFDIVLINPQLVYFPGQTVQGQLVIVLNAAMKMRGIRVRFRGRCQVMWSEGSGDNRRTYSSNEDYFDETMLLHGQAPSETNATVELPAGRHVFTFQFDLPPQLPQSFEGKKFCYVRYWIKGTIDKPWKFDPEVKLPFTVGGVLDLNSQPEFAVSTQSQDSKTVCCCCCESEPVTALCRLDRVGYVPGEAISISAELDNKCGREVVTTKARLYMEIIYQTHGGHKHRETRELGRVEHGVIEDGGSDVWLGEKIVVPPVPPSFLHNCSLIDINYYVEFKADVAETPFDLVLRLDVVIGSIPLQSVVEQFYDSRQAPPITTQPSSLGYGLPSNLNMPPPSYRECTFGKVDITDNDDKHASGNMNYAPQYMYYDWLKH